MSHPYMAKLIDLRETTGNRGCECWDCLRAAGVTPKLADRERFPQLYPFRIFKSDDEGVPRAAKKGGAKPEQATGEERRHLREAVANRDVI